MSFASRPWLGFTELCASDEKQLDRCAWKATISSGRGILRRRCHRRTSRSCASRLKRGWPGTPRNSATCRFLDPEVVYEDEILPDHVGETYRGADGFRKAWSRAVDPWESIERSVEWIREAEDNVVSCHTGD